MEPKLDKKEVYWCSCDIFRTLQKAIRSESSNLLLKINRFLIKIANDAGVLGWVEVTNRILNFRDKFSKIFVLA